MQKTKTSPALKAKHNSSYVDPDGYFYQSMYSTSSSTRTGIKSEKLDTLLNKGRTTTDVLFIDASREYQDDKRQNRLREQDIDKIVGTYKAYRTVPKYAQRATLEEIVLNEGQPFPFRRV